MRDEWCVEMVGMGLGRTVCDCAGVSGVTGVMATPRGHAPGRRVVAIVNVSCKIVCVIPHDYA